MRLPRLLLPFALGLMLTWAACKTRLPHSTQEELGKSLFVAFQKDDTSALQRLLATRADVEAAIGVDSLPAAEKANVDAEIRALLQDFHDMSAVAFDEVKRRAKEDGVDWKQAKFVKATTEDCRTADTEICDIVVHFSAGGKVWEIFIDDAGKADSGWILGFETMSWMGEVL
jgi:hypothetical protein